MNSNTNTVRTSPFARRVLPIIGIVTLTVALGACQTPPQGVGAPQPHVVKMVEPPAGVDLSRPADRIEEQLQRDAAETAATAGRFQGMTPDAIERVLASESAARDAATVSQAAPTAPQGVMHRQ